MKKNETIRMLIGYHENGKIESMYWEYNSILSLIKIDYYENGNIMYKVTNKFIRPKFPNTLCHKWIRFEYYKDGTIKEKSSSGTFLEYDSKYDINMDDSYTIEYYENGNIKSEIRGINKNSSLDEPIETQYDIDGNILKRRYFLYGIGYITQKQLDKCNKRLQSKIKLRTHNHKELNILHYLAKKYNYKDKIDQIEELMDELLTLNKLTEN